MIPVLFITPLLLTTIGCGGDDSSSSTSSASTPLLGTWLNEYSSQCALGLSFIDNGKYLFQDICVEGSTLYNEVELGSYTVTGNNVTFTNEKNSCSGTPIESDTAQFSVNGSNLFLQFDGGSLNFNKIVGNEDSETFTMFYGCWQEDGSFVQNSSFRI